MWVDDDCDIDGHWSVEPDPYEGVGLVDVGGFQIKSSLLPLRSVSMAAARCMSVGPVPKKHPIGFAKRK